MANVDRPFGARIAQGGTAGMYSARATQYKADGELYRGAFVKFNSDGKVEQADTGDDFVGVVIAVGHTGDQLEHDTHGRQGFFNPDDLTNKGSSKIPSGDEGIALVVDDPNVVIQIQAADGVSDLTVGDTYDITNEDQGNDIGGMSEVELNDGQTNNDVIVVGSVDRVDNDPESEHAEWLVRINPANHVFAS